MMALQANIRQKGDAVLARDQERHAMLVRGAYDTFARGELADLAPVLALDAVGHEYDGACHRATYHGRDAILSRLDDLAPTYWSEVRIRIHTVAATGPLIAAIATWQGTSHLNGHTYTIRHVLVVRVAGRRVTELWLIRDAPNADATP